MPKNKVIQAALRPKTPRMARANKDLWVSGEFMMRLQLQLLQLGSL